MNGQVHHYHLEVEIRDEGVPAIIKLRRILKGMLRFYDARCTSAIEVDDRGNAITLDAQASQEDDRE